MFYLHIVVYKEKAKIIIITIVLTAKPVCLPESLLFSVPIHVTGDLKCYLSLNFLQKLTSVE